MLVSMHRVSPHTFTHLHTPAARFISPTLIVGTVGETLLLLYYSLASSHRSRSSAAGAGACFCVSPGLQSLNALHLSFLLSRITSILG